jgi:phosphate-selective porin OprO/OprP
MKPLFHLSARARIAAPTLAMAVLACVPASVGLGQELETRFDRLWANAQLYQGDAESLIKSAALSGRFQIDQTNVDSGDADLSDLDLRRFRFGVKLKFAGSLTLHTEADFDPAGGNLGYERLTDTYFSWSPADAFALKVGKQGAAFTMDGQTSSKELLTIDRSNLANNIWFPEEYISGVTASGTKSGFVYELGIFTSGERDRGFGDSSGGEFTLATVGYDFGESMDASKALLRVNYVDNEPDPRNTSTRPLEQVLSVNFAFERARWGVRSDVSSARGYLGQGDLRGLMLMPYVKLSDDVQLVVRYTHLDSDDPNSIRFARYESAIAGGRGDEYREIHVGVNYFLYGHKLKFQSGLQYADMADSAMDGGDYTGWSWTTGFRVSW